MNQQSDEQQFHMEHFDKRGQIKMQLSSTAQKIATQITNNSEFTCGLNNHLDPFNKAESQICSIDIEKAVQFQHYFIKYKHRDQRAKVFDTMRDLLIERGYNQISQVRDREQEQIMVVRVVEKAQNLLNTFIIQDEFGKDKLVVKEGIMWVGMICAIKAKWIQGTYRLQKIIDLSTPIPQTKAQLAANTSVNRIMFLKGPFRPKYKKKDMKNQDPGIRIVAKQIQKLRKNNIIINQLIVMGPILAKNNEAVQKFTLERSYQEQYEYILQILKSQVHKVNSDIKIYVMPSLEDIVSLYPIPQPPYKPEGKRIQVKHLSNPSSLKIQGIRSNYKIDLINYDILKYIQTHKAGKNTKQLRQQIFQTYIKQPFYLSNTTSSQDSFDQTNINNLFNNGNFGDLIVYSSNTSPPICTQVNGRIIMNIGSLGVDYHYTGKNFIVIASIYEGIGPVSQRIKMEIISHG